jgi:hypothetical protein
VWAGNGRQADFEVVFGDAGVWASLLSRGDGYLRTEVQCEVQERGQYRVKDFWAWHRDFEVFRPQFHAEFERFEEWLRTEKVIEKEQFLCAYYGKFDDGSDEDLVLS